MPDRTFDDKKTVTHSARFLGWFLLALGLFLAGTVILCTVYLPDPWWVFFFVTIPGCGLSSLLFLNGWASAQSRITLSPDRLTLRVPTWRATQLPPMHSLEAPWSEITAVDYRTEFYSMPFFGAFPSEAYRIRTKDRAVIIGGRQFFRNQSIMETILRRANLDLTAYPDVNSGIWEAIRKGPPPWGKA